MAQPSCPERRSASQNCEYICVYMFKRIVFFLLAQDRLLPIFKYLFKLCMLQLTIHCVAFLYFILLFIVFLSFFIILSTNIAFNTLGLLTFFLNKSTSQSTPPPDLFISYPFIWFSGCLGESFLIVHPLTFNTVTRNLTKQGVSSILTRKPNYLITSSILRVFVLSTLEGKNTAAAKGTTNKKTCLCTSWYFMNIQCMLSIWFRLPIYNFNGSLALTRISSGGASRRHRKTEKEEDEELLHEYVSLTLLSFRGKVLSSLFLFLFFSSLANADGWVYKRFIIII